MTATQLYTELSNTTLVGLKISDLGVSQNVTNLLAFINEAKDKIAEDTMLWLGGETFDMVNGTSEYTLTTTPIQIIDVFDENNYIRERNNQGTLGYFQTSPNTLMFNTVTDGLGIKVNYYYSPPDYSGASTIIMPNTLIHAMKKYVSSKAFELYKGDTDIAKSQALKTDYINMIKDFRATTDSLDVDSVINMNNKIWLRSIR